MATIKVRLEVESAGNTPFTLDELSEVTNYLRTPTYDFGRSFSGGMDFRVVDQNKFTIVLEAEGEFL